MRSNICIHFTGLGVECCKAGIHLRQQFDDSTPGIGLRIPCVQDGKESRLSCEKLRLPTPDEVAKDEAETNELIANYEKVGEMVKNLKEKHRVTGWRGIVECPVCGGKLHLSISSHNGHASGCCETGFCIHFQE